MGKRSNFLRRKNDNYPTPFEALRPLLPFITPGSSFIEPCAGKGQLVTFLENQGMFCLGTYDLIDADARTYQEYPSKAQYFITNPPWTRQILHPIIENLRVQKPTWLLFDAAWCYTKQASPYLKYCNKIVAVGRVQWFLESLYTSKDDAAWYLFGKEEILTTFYGVRP